MKNFLKLFFAIHLKGRFPGKSQGRFQKFIKKIGDNIITDYLILLFNCRFFILLYHKNSIETKNTVQFSTSSFGETASRMDS